MPAADPLRQNADGSFIWAKAWPHRRDFDLVRCRRTLDEPGARGGGCRLDWRTVTRLARWASNAFIFSIDDVPLGVRPATREPRSALFRAGESFRSRPPRA